MKTITLVRHGESEANAGLPSHDPALIPLTAKGALQTAIEDAGLNPFPDAPDTADMKPTTAYAANGEANLGNRSTNVPGWITQGDILQSIGAVLSARSDTFTVRVYGDVLDPLDSTKVISRAWCEATVQRYPDYVDTTVSAAAAPISLWTSSPPADDRQNV